MEEKKGLCDKCKFCFVKIYEIRDESKLKSIKECEKNRLHVQNDFIDVFDMPIKCNRFIHIDAKKYG